MSHNARILIVDDEPNVRLVFRTALEASDYSITTAADGTFYAAGADYRVYLSAGTVDGVSVVGALIGTFSIKNRVTAFWSALAFALLPGVVFSTRIISTDVPLLLDMPELRAVGLSDTAVTNAALPLLARLPHLEALDLDGTVIDDAAVEPLASFPNLEFLHVTRTMLRQSGIRELRQRLPHCEIVSDW